MAKDVIMPALGMAQETGILLQWLKAAGETVTQGEPLMEVETDKATVEIEAPASGILARVIANPGDEIPVGQVIAVILAPGESVGEQGTRGAEEQKDEKLSAFVASAVIASPVAARMAAEHNVDLAQVKPQGGRVQKADLLAYLEAKANSGQRYPKGISLVVGGQLLASPKARRLAAERGLELATLKGSGPDGAVLAADVEEAMTRRDEDAITRGHEAEQIFSSPHLVASSEDASSPPRLLASLTMSKMWRVAAERLTQSWTTIPHFYLIREANASQLTEWRGKAQARATEKITYTDLLVKIVATSLRRHPRLNAMWQEGSILLNEEVNLGLAVAIEDGLVVPVIHQANQLGLNELAARRKELVARAQAGKLSLADISGGTFTISNLGMYGVDAFNAIINPPQAAILAVSRIADRVVPVNGQPAVQPMITFSLSCDHRVVDGARGAQFLQTLAELVEEPMRLLD